MVRIEKVDHLLIEKEGGKKPGEKTMAEGHNYQGKEREE